MVNLAQAWAEAFMEANPDAFIAVTGGGSGTGIASLMNQTCEIAQSSRDMSPKEYEMAAERGLNVQEVEVGLDAIVVIVHPSNPVDGLTVRQLSDIFTGRVRNWKEVGGRDERILVLSRDRNSGTHIFFLEHIVRQDLDGDKSEFAPQVLMLSSSHAIEQEVASNPSSIGYFGMGYLNDRVKGLKVKGAETEEWTHPTIADVRAGNYPVSRALHFYLPQAPSAEVKKFIDFVLSPEGQAIVLEMDFVPITS